MWGILMYYLDEYLYYRETGRQMLYSTGLKKRPWQYIADKLCARAHKAQRSRAARWCGQK